MSEMDVLKFMVDQSTNAWPGYWTIDQCCVDAIKWAINRIEELENHTDYDKQLREAVRTQGPPYPGKCYILVDDLLKPHLSPFEFFGKIKSTPAYKEAFEKPWLWFSRPDRWHEIGGW